ncbi:hypothetical protein [Marinicella litoralis]|uniref:Uncharacterized protein n=1 Tax=Marinicella litoralis TaxID=644220 RepID=A0A4R6XML8_9GAMM|nr:hypothetical protein [Marinicella litoralis]TDR19340.1 hypothetical protein C8D91_1889 [Marinicella litoralis]
MISLQHSFLTSFLKASSLTVLMIGGLLAQSYATTALFSDTVMKMNIEFSSTEDNSEKPQVASMTVHNEQESSIAFGDHQINIKTTFIKWTEDAVEPEQILAELKLLKLADNGDIINMHKPTLMIDKDKWAEFRIAPSDEMEGIEFKMKYEDYNHAEDDNAMNDEPAWLNWDLKSAEAEVC